MAPIKGISCPFHSAPGGVRLDVGRVSLKGADRACGYGAGAADAVAGGSSARAMAKKEAAADRAAKPLRSSSEPLIAIVKSADLRKGDDLALVRRLYRSRLWAILFEGEVGPGVVIIPQVG